MIVKHLKLITPPPRPHPIMVAEGSLKTGEVQIYYPHILRPIRDVI